MKFAVALITASVIATILPSSLMARPMGNIEFVAGGTQVPIHVVGEISSANSAVSDIFDVQASDDVVVHGKVVIKKGALGKGEIVEVDKAGGNGHSGKLRLKFDWIYAADGGKVRLSNNAVSRAEADRKGASSTFTLIGAATFGIGGLFAHNFARGKEVTIDEHKQLNAYIASNVHIRALEPSSSDHFDQ